jgi:hypothetical protein
LLHALKLICCRRWSERDGSPWSGINLYVVDTTKFPDGTFVLDLDLMDFLGNCEGEYSEYGLVSLQHARQTTYHYFGEYLSQGALRIEGKCQVIPSSLFFDPNRMEQIQSTFSLCASSPARTSESEDGAFETHCFRLAIWLHTPEEPPTLRDMLASMKAVRDITDTLDPEWRLPMAVYFAALAGPVSAIRVKERSALRITFLELFAGCFLHGSSPHSSG